MSKRARFTSMKEETLPLRRTVRTLMREISLQRQKNTALQKTFQTFLQCSTSIFRVLVDAQKREFCNPLVTETMEAFTSYSSMENISFASQQTTPTLSGRVNNDKVKLAQDALKELESLGRVVDRANFIGMTQAVPVRSFQSSGSETAYDTDVERKAKSNVIEEIWIHDSDDEPLIDTQDNSTLRSQAPTTNCRSSLMRPAQLKVKEEPPALIVLGKVVKNQTCLDRRFGKPDSRLKGGCNNSFEDLGPLDLSQRSVSLTPVPTQRTFVMTKDNASTGKKRSAAASACSKCGKEFVNFKLHSRSAHDYGCTQRDCNMSFRTAKDLREHSVKHRKGYMSKFLSSVQTNFSCPEVDT